MVPPATHLLVGYLVLSACITALLTVLAYRTLPRRNRKKMSRR